jgi:hypothetical protein
MKLQKTKTILTICFLISLGATTMLALPLGSARPALASTGTAVFTVIVSRNGFNGTSTTLDLTVHQGDWVQITFVYGDGDLSYDNPHQIAIEGYGIQTAVLSRSNPNSTLRFVADQSGTFRIYCNIPCNGMSNLQSGALVVLPADGRIPTQTTLTSSNQTTFMLLFATVNEANGTPLGGVPVKFYENTTFGPLWLQTTLTSSKGEAEEQYTPNRSGTIQIIATYPGNGTFTNSSGAVTFLVPGNGSTPGNTNFYGMNFPFNLAMIAVPRLVNFAIVIVVGAIVLGIWSNYAYILREILSLPKRGNESASETRKRAKQVLRKEALTHREITIVSIGGGLTRRLLVLAALSPLIGVAGIALANRFNQPPVMGLLELVGVAAAYVAVIFLILVRDGRIASTG